MVGYCFVNNITIVQISPSPNTPTEDTVKLSQEGLNIFARAARATRVQVRVYETKWYLLDFAQYPAGNWDIAKKNAHLSLENHKEDKQIVILPPLQSSRILGVWISPEESSHEQKKRLHQTTTSWDDRVRTGNISKSDVWFYFQTTVKTSI